MEQVAAVAARITELQQRITPAAGFADFLSQQLATGTQAPPAVGATGFPTAQTPGANAALGLFGTQAAAGATAVASPAPGGTLVMPVEGRISSKFGMRVHPITGKSRMHSGLDIAAPTGTPIKAVAGGVVSFAGVRGGYGNTVIVDHPDGTQTLYAHKDTIGVRSGDRVQAGQTIGTVGSTGQSTGPHLHLEVRKDGEPVDPAPLLGL